VAICVVSSSSKDSTLSRENVLCSLRCLVVARYLLATAWVQEYKPAPCRFPEKRLNAFLLQVVAMASVLTPQVMGWLRWVFVEVNDIPFDLCWTAHVAFSRREWKYNSYLYALASCMVVRTGPAILLLSGVAHLLDLHFPF